ncbi:TatD family hydrolase [Marinomonas ostreistagni]|uniref:TatD family hydrolase n=1 Tax=Marinomonas ostreistagni TaxID=359209 RepID=A0ABS0Z860_9GAMM|nr:TatD family hydrolase [Marinomonas ostreistagni]MBJ7549186.1 TatD family hydrolase [Marinomonas ostreistagni]
MYIDSHCHLDFPQFKDLPDLISSCSEVGVNEFLVPGTTEGSWSSLIKIRQNYPQIKIALGLHPYFLNERVQLDQAMQKLEHFLGYGSVVAVGEIGLDKWPNMPDYHYQFEVLLEQLRLAKRHNMPVILHARKSEDDLLKAIRMLNFDRGGVVHAFNGSFDQAQRFINDGFVLGIGGTVTYPRASKARRVLQALADEHFVIETDAPDMPLCGYQGQPNSPIRVVEVAEQVAILRGQSVEAVAQYTSANLQRVLPNWYKVK